MKQPLSLRILDAVERAGTKLPDPVSLFMIAALIVVIGSAIGSALGVSVVHPGTGKTVSVVNLLATDQLRRMFTDAVANFTNFPPLGLVLVTMIGISIAERGGFINALLRSTVNAVPRQFVTAGLVFAGVNSSIAADAGYIVLIPLGAVIFASIGRHPLAGLSATFAGVAGGFSANVSITSLDPLLGGITQSAAQFIRPEYTVSAAANWYFMIVSTFMLTVVGTLVCERLVEPRLGPWQRNDQDDTHGALSPTERRAMTWSIVTFVALCVGIAAIALPQGSILRAPDGATTPLEKSVVVILMLIFLVSGIVYAKLTGTVKNDKDIAAMAGDGMATMGGYIVLSFIMAQFIAYFAWSNLGVVTAVNGAELLRSLNLSSAPVLLSSFVVVACIINLLISSASAKWAIMAPVFVPMFMQLGIAPEATQVAYRVGDSSTNMVAPLMGYLPLIIVAMRRYRGDASLGTLLSLMLPYSVAFLVSWLVLLLIWLVADLPLGPGVTTLLAPTP